MLATALGLALWSPVALAATASEVTEAFYWLAGILIAAKIGTLVERVGQPAVLGEILMGVLLGAMALFGLPDYSTSKALPLIDFLAQLGAVILLFQIGLESNLGAMRKVGARAFWVAVIGVAAPFAIGTFVVGPWLAPGLSDNAYLFLGATLTATSVGITGRVFRDMCCLHRVEAQIVLGAAVIDDVLGLIILSIVGAIATRGVVSPAELALVTVQALGFLVVAIGLGKVAAGPLSRLWSRIDRGPGMKVCVALATCLAFAWLASLMGLAPIVGAFAAGLVLDDVVFGCFAEPGLHRDLRAAVADARPETRARVERVLEGNAHRHLESMLEPIGHMMVPVFFVVAGMQVRVEHLVDPKILSLALALTVAAILGKLVSGLVAGKVDRWLVGWGMVPRGEVGLIFAVVGKTLGVVDDELFSVIVLMVLLTTLVTPVVLATLIRRDSRAAAPAAAVEPDHGR